MTFRLGKAANWSFSGFQQTKNSAFSAAWVVSTILIATLGNWLGGMSSYFLGRLGRWEVLERYFGLSKSRVETFKNQIEGWGGFLAFFCCIGSLIKNQFTFEIV